MKARLAAEWVSKSYGVDRCRVQTSATRSSYIALAIAWSSCSVILVFCLARVSSISSTLGVTAVSAAPMLRAAFRSVVRSDSRISRVPLSNKR